MVLTSTAKFFPHFSLKMQGEQQLQEQGMFQEGHFRALCGGNLCTGGEQAVQTSREFGQGRSCSSSLGICLWLWLTVAVLPQPALL